MTQVNLALREFCKSHLKGMLAKCTSGEQHKFKQMYSHKNLDLHINDVVDKMVDDQVSPTSEVLARINNAMNQCQRTLDKK